MGKTFKKQGLQEFKARIGRVDSFYARHGFSKPIVSNRCERPVLWSIIGFAWIGFVISIAENRAYLEESLAQGALSAQHRDWILYALAALVVVSAIKLGFHAMRCLLRGREQRGVSGSLLVGALGAIVVTQIPADALHGGVEVLGAGTQAILLAATDTAEKTIGVDTSTIAFVSRSITD
ncbi:hypothetical protein SAMN05421853_103163 [Roseivivax halotolerans]|uniref:Uncharacterized protein n=1 Tax=Roseivivax halotolerans TaxID=93684 RepID=A0A1I5X613_9RHOB|nr:hypothetical protein [Roseivivax halotolerans]SFQ27384.1 hypothetical protein SAMN05421853_103163 [Roseivivax halotolerans]